MRRRSLLFVTLLAVMTVIFSTLPALAGDVSAEEEQFIYELNEARRDPPAYAASHLSGSVATLVASFDARPPLAVSGLLGDAAQARTDDMVDDRYFAHYNPTTGFGPSQALTLVGYEWSSWGENIGLGYRTPTAMVIGFLQSDSGHRESVMGQGSTASTFRDIGVGYRTDTGDLRYDNIWTASLAHPRVWTPSITGVLYDDTNGNGRMDLGEGLGGVSVRAGSVTATTNGGGGWTLPTGSGTWLVSASGGTLPGEMTTTATVGSDNVWVELVVGVMAAPPAPDLRPAPCVGGTCDSVGLVDGGGEWSLWDGLEAGDGLEGFFFGDPGDVPFMGDWDGDGVATPGLYRRSDGFVYLRDSNTQGVADRTFFFGNPGDWPLVGDFNGDGRDTVSIFRESEARVYVMNALGVDGGGLGAADYEFSFGNPGDQPFVGDFDGDGIDTVGLYRTSTGFVYFRNSLDTGIADFEFFYGDPGDVILAGDWDGDGDDTVAVYRPSDGRVYVNLENTAGAADYYVYVGDYPTAVTWGRTTR